MAGSKTTYLAQKLLDHGLGGDTWAQPATVYVVLSTAAFDPNATGAGANEIAAGDYARFAVANNLTEWTGATLASPAEKHNVHDFIWAVATSDWGTPQSAYLADAAVDGNLLYGSDITNPQVIGAGDTAKIPATTFVFEEQ